MAKCDVLEKIQYIENKYPVETIAYKNIKLWPFIRASLFDLYYCSDQKVKDRRGGRNRLSNIVRLFRSIRYTSLPLLFNRYASIIFTDDVGMKNHAGIYIDRTMEGIFAVENRIIPVVIKILPPEVISVVSYIHSDFFALLIRCFSYCLTIRKNHIRAESVLMDILSELQIQFDFYKYIRIINAALCFYNMWFAVIKPKKIYINCYYDILRMPAFFIAKKRNVPVIEIQHGSITTEPAYKAFKYVAPNPYPNYLLVFGDRFKLGVSDNIYHKDCVFTVGSYYIDLMRQEVDINKRLFEKKYGFLKDKIIITVASQYDIDRDILTFVEQAARLDSRLFFIFIPRFVKDYHHNYKNDGIVIETELDVYQCMQNSHITSAVLSTGAIESLAFGTPVVLMNIDGLARFSYGEFFKGFLSVLYANCSEEFIEKINEAIQFDRNVVREEGRLFFADNHQERLKKALTIIDEKKYY